MLIILLIRIISTIIFKLVILTTPKFPRLTALFHKCFAYGCNASNPQLSFKKIKKCPHINKKFY